MVLAVPESYGGSLQSNTQAASGSRSPLRTVTVYRGVKEITFTGAGQTFPLRQVYIVTERTILHDGQILLVPDVEVATYWTTLDLDSSRIEELYHDHATSEQFHSEIKTEMDLERLPAES